MKAKGSLINIYRISQQKKSIGHKCTGTVKRRDGDIRESIPHKRITSIQGPLQLQSVDRLS